jgi:hypothetical protein
VLPVAHDSALEAWVATVNTPVLQLHGQALATQALLHDEVVSAALANGQTPLPARFGVNFPDDASCIAMLSNRATQIRAALRRLAGTVEMAVLIVPAHASALPGAETAPLKRDEHSAGRRYLEKIRERARLSETLRSAVEELCRDIQKAVRDVACDESRGRASTGVVSIAHLVRRENVTLYRDSLRTVPVRDDLRMVVAGPRAPYSFVGEGTLPTGHDSGSPSGND